MKVFIVVFIITLWWTLDIINDFLFDSNLLFAILCQLAHLFCTWTDTTRESPPLNAWPVKSSGQILQGRVPLNACHFKFYGQILWGRVAHNDWQVKSYWRRLRGRVRSVSDKWSPMVPSMPDMSSPMDRYYDWESPSMPDKSSSMDRYYEGESPSMLICQVQFASVCIEVCH